MPIRIRKVTISEAQKAILANLQKQHPALRQIKPLAIGIHEQLREAHPELSKTQIRRLLAYFCHSQKYAEACLKPGAQRWDLSGRRSAITPEQIEYAKALQDYWKHRRAPKPAKVKILEKRISAQPQDIQKVTITVRRRRRVKAS